MNETIYETSSNVANFFLSKAKEENTHLTQLKLMKISYFAYGWVLATLHKKLFEEEIEAWRFGPVIPSLYHEFKHYKYNAINAFSTSFDFENGKETIPQIDKSDKSSVILEKVWDIYKHLSAESLVNKTHEKDTPWAKYYTPGEYGTVIPDDIIKSYFKQKISDLLSDDQDK